MRTISRLIGFSPAVLRAWERRYGLLQPERGPGGHRLYTDDDLKVLHSIKDLLDEGRSIGEAAELGRDKLLATHKIPSASEPPQKQQAPTGSVTEDYQHKILEAALALDSQRLTSTIDQVFSLVSPEYAIRNILFPAAREIGESWVKGQCSVASEHLMSHEIVLRLRKLLEIAQVTRPAARQALCACFPDEQHEMGLLNLAYQLSCYGIPITYLGPCLPLEDLEMTCQTLKPRFVFLSVTRSPLYESHKPELVKLLERQQNDSSFHIGGPGVPSEDAALTNMGVRLWGPDSSQDALLRALGVSD